MWLRDNSSAAMAVEDRNPIRGSVSLRISSTRIWSVRATLVASCVLGVPSGHKIGHAISLTINWSGISIRCPQALLNPSLLILSLEAMTYGRFFFCSDPSMRDVHFSILFDLFRINIFHGSGEKFVSFIVPYVGSESRLFHDVRALRESFL